MHCNDLRCKGIDGDFPQTYLCRPLESEHPDESVMIPLPNRCA